MQNLSPRRGEPKAVLLVASVVGSSRSEQSTDADTRAISVIQQAGVFESLKKNQGGISANVASNNEVRLESNQKIDVGQDAKIIGVRGEGRRTSTIDSCVISVVSKPDPKGLITVEASGQSLKVWRFVCVRRGQPIPQIADSPPPIPTPSTKKEEEKKPAPPVPDVQENGKHVQGELVLEPLVPTVTVHLIPTSRIRPNPDQPRKTFRPGSIKEIADSMMKYGQHEAIEVIRIIGDPNADFELVKGERRWRAAKRIGLKKLKAVVVDEEVVSGKLVQSFRCFVTDFNREPYVPVDTMRALKRYHDAGMTTADIAAGCGKSQAWISSHLILDRLEPELLDLLDPALPKNERLSLTVARLLSTVRREKQKEIYTAVKDITSARLQVLETKRLISQQSDVTVRARRKYKPSDGSSRLKVAVPRILSDALSINQITEGSFRSLAIHSKPELCKLLGYAKDARTQLEEIIGRLEKAAI